MPVGESEIERANEHRVQARWKLTSALLVASIGLTMAGWARQESTDAPSPSDDSPSYDAKGDLIRPADYREWVFLTSGLGMTYGPAKAASSRAPLFDNVFVNRTAYRAFMESGTWPDRTILILEVRRGVENVSINQGGRTQGDLVAFEAAVKDRGRFPEAGWGYFSFDGPDGPVGTASRLPETASCYKCHAEHAAVDNTFVQFYPTLFEVAKEKGTVEASFDPGRKP